MNTSVTQKTYVVALVILLAVLAYIALAPTADASTQVGGRSDRTREVGAPLPGGTGGTGGSQGGTSGESGQSGDSSTNETLDQEAAQALIDEIVDNVPNESDFPSQSDIDEATDPPTIPGFLALFNTFLTRFRDR
ncbi:hypothetical protein HY971_04530 [Candidatus Kaiserbacteria bacterium]|nr:hypothetical protein [Candidatus Kaiserbacteria bacterium]